MRRGAILFAFLGVLIARPAGAGELRWGGLIDASLEKSRRYEGGTPSTLNDGNATFRADFHLFVEASLSDEAFLFGNLHYNRVEEAFARLGIPGTPLAVQAGRFGTPFGNFVARRLSPRNPVLGLPLLYLHRTALLDDPLPGSAADLLAARGRGHAVPDPGDPSGSRSGVRVINWGAYDTGAMVLATGGRAGASVAITNRSLSTANYFGTTTGDLDSKGSFGVVGRVYGSPVLGLVVGASAATAPFVPDGVPLPPGKSKGDYRQTTAGLDLEYSRGHLVAYAEGVWNRWRIPTIADDLGLLDGYVEAKYTFHARVFGALRVERMSFDLIDRGDGRRVPWEYAQTRVEAGAGVHIRRGLLAKASYQWNVTDREDDPPDDRAGALLSAEF